MFYQNIPWPKWNPKTDVVFFQLLQNSRQVEVVDDIWHSIYIFYFYENAFSKLVDCHLKDIIVSHQYKIFNDEYEDQHKDIKVDNLKK